MTPTVFSPQLPTETDSPGFHGVDNIKSQTTGTEGVWVSIGDGGVRVNRMLKAPHTWHLQKQPDLCPPTWLPSNPQSQVGSIARIRTNVDTVHCLYKEKENMSGTAECLRARWGCSQPFVCKPQGLSLKKQQKKNLLAFQGAAMLVRSLPIKSRK